jgi:hypothetical protein
MNDNLKSWDVFISHASEDKDLFVRPLAIALQSLGVSVWYDEFSLHLGESLSRSIDKGLAQSRFGLVVITSHFLQKPWPEYELRGLVAQEIEAHRVILPIWHGVTRQQVVQFSPPLADKLALRTEGLSAQDVAIQVLRETCPDLYANHPRSELERIASGAALRDLQKEMDRTQKELEQTREELAEYRCPYCGAQLSSRIHAPTDPEQNDWDVREEFLCGYQTFGGYIESPCPSDPRFPKFEDYELNFFNIPEEPRWPWQCYAMGRTDMARRLRLSPGHGATREEAERELRDHYDRYAKR